MQPQPATYSPEPDLEKSVESQLDLVSLLRILRRRKWPILGMLVLGTGAAVLASQTITPRYRATALVMLEAREARITDIPAVVGDLFDDPANIGAHLETQIRLMISRSTIAEVVDALNLVSDPEFHPPPPEETELALFNDSWLRLLPWVPPSWAETADDPEEAETAGVTDEETADLAEEETAGVTDEETADLAEEAETAPASTEPDPAASTATPPADLAAQPDLEHVFDRFAQRLSVAPEGRSFVIGVGFSSSDPEKAATIANKVVDVYIEKQRAMKRESTAKAAVWLGERSASLKTQLEVAEEAAQRYRVENRLAHASKTDLFDNQLSNLNLELNTAVSDLATRQGRLAFIADLRRRGEALDTLPEVMGSSLILDLRRQETELLRQEAEARGELGEKHPRMQLIRAEQARIEEKIASEVGRIVANLENEARIVAGRVERLRVDFEALREMSATREEAAVRLNELERQASALRQLYESFLQRHKETEQQQDLIDADARVISPASPPLRPSTPGTTVFAVVGFGASGVLAVLLALLIERLSDGLRSESQVRQVLGLTRIGLVPRLGRHLEPGSHPHTHLIDRPFSAYTESIRSVFSALKVADRQAPAKLILVTSALPGEGKTTLALSLAVSAAQAGERVLLVDLDLRRPRVLERLNRERMPGICECIAGEATLQDVIVFDPDARIDVLGTGRPTFNPTAVLQSPRFIPMLRALHGYDRVIIDSPPVLAVSDAQLLAAAVDKVLLVVRWQKTGRELARNATSLLRQAQATILGAVITQVDVKKHMRYGYGDVGDCYHKYRSYYTS